MYEYFSQHQPTWRAPAPTGSIAPDCRHYSGDKPCPQNRLCRGCAAYSPYAFRIVIIKLGALGDVIRTLCLLPELRRQYPQAHITWVTKPNGCQMLADHPLIDRILAFDPLNILALTQEDFDLAINLDKEPGPCALEMALPAQRKMGIGQSVWGTPIPLNPEAEPYFHLGLSDDLKFRRNTKSYPQLIHEALGLTYHDQRYTLPVNPSAQQRIRQHLAQLGWQEHRPTVGINVGSGAAFANKMWPAGRLVQVITALHTQTSAVQVLLLGGRAERPIIDRILRELPRAAAPGRVFDPGTEHDEPAFVALVNACDTIFTGDTMALHVALALGKPVAVFFGPTCAQEIDLFGAGVKLIARPACAPCYKQRCDQHDVCVNEISVADAVRGIGQLLPETRFRSLPLPIYPIRRAG